MPRSFSWLPRLAEIRRSVKNSVRSHYESKDIERLFQVQRRTAQGLMLAVSPAAKVGRSFLVAARDLEAFLDRIAENPDPSSLLGPPPASEPRRTLRELVQVDRLATTLNTAPSNMTIEPGRVSISFNSMEELAGPLLALAEILNDHAQFALFEQRFLPAPSLPPDEEGERAAISRMWDDLDALERKQAEKSVLSG